MTAGTPQDLDVLAAFAPALAATFASVASDIALVVDAHGVIRHRAVGADTLAESTERWVGQRWVDTVTSDTRHKIELLLQEAATGRAARRREVSHPSLHGLDIPMAWAAIRLGENGPVLAVGRDMRAVAAIQQRFVDAQQEIERDYWKRRRAEAHYELLFQVANDAVFVVSGDTFEVVEANTAAEHLVGQSASGMIGRPFPSIGAPASRSQLDELLRMARSSGNPAEVRGWLSGPNESAEGRPVDISAVPVRVGGGDGRVLILVRARTVARSDLASESQRRFAEFVERTPDAIAITDSSGAILSTNPAFAQLSLAGEDALHGRRLPAVVHDEANTLESVLQRTRSAGLASAVQMRVHQPAHGTTLLEVSAVLLAEGDQERVGFTFRRLEQTVEAAAPIAGRFAQALWTLGAELDDRLGHRPLQALVDHANRVIEFHLIDRALERNGGDRLQAAAELGIAPDELEARRARHTAQAARHGSGDAVS